VASRLHLAALYSATGTLLPESPRGLTRGERALELLPKCWKNEGLTPEELASLHNVAEFSRHIPAIVLRYDLMDNACRVT
jgi:hypothetical protein